MQHDYLDMNHTNKWEDMGAYVGKLHFDKLGSRALNNLLSLSLARTQA